MDRCFRYLVSYGIASLVLALASWLAHLDKVANQTLRRFTKLGQSFNFRSKILAISTRVLVNQIFFTPLFLCAFFTLQNTFQAGRFVSPKETVERLKKTIPTAYGNSCKLWPAVTAVNFWIVPFEYRALFGGLFWLPFHFALWC